MTDPSGMQVATGPTPLALNAWTHMAATYNGSFSILYVNGAPAANQPVSGSIPPSIGPLRFGGNSIWGEYFAGRLDNIRIYNRPLTQAEIQSDMNTSVGTCVVTPGYWQNHTEAWCMQSIQ